MGGDGGPRRRKGGEEGEQEEAAGGRAVTKEAAPRAAWGGQPPCLAHRREGHGDGPEQGEPRPHVHPSPVRMRGSAAAYRRSASRLPRPTIPLASIAAAAAPA